jgi:hypothetical protein
VSAFFANFAESLAHFAVKSFNRKDRKGFRKGRKETLSRRRSQNGRLSRKLLLKILLYIGLPNATEAFQKT